MTKRQYRERVQVPTGAEAPDEVRQALLADVRARMESGEFDSEMALVETALALLDGDVVRDE